MKQIRDHDLYNIACAVRLKPDTTH
jgi:hypothetical protein